MNRRRGFTLVEALVAALLVVLAVAGGLTLVAQGRRAHRSAEVRARLEDTTRAALDLLAYELRMAGFIGRLPPGSAIAGMLPAGTTAPAGLTAGGGCVESLALDLGSPIAGADGTYGASATIALGCRPAPGGRVVPGSDTLVLRRVSASAATPTRGRLQLESTRSLGRLFTDGGRTLGPGAQVNDVEVSAFYVSADSTGETGYPSLRRKRLVGGTAPAFQDEELVAGIEDLQVEAAIERAGSGSSDDTYVPLAEVRPDVPIRSLRIWVLARSDLPEPTVHGQPSLAYANRVWPATEGRYARQLASRSVEPRNKAIRP